MDFSIKDRIARTNRWTWIRIALLLVFSYVILYNSMTLRSPLIGISSSFVVLFLSSLATSDVFFHEERPFLKQMLGLAAFMVIIALFGVFLMLVAIFTETLSLVSFVGIGLILSLLSAFVKNGGSANASEQSKSQGGGKKKSYFLITVFLVSILIAFYALLLARTDDGVTSVWLTIPSFFLPLFFISTLSLVLIVFFSEINVGLKLAFVSLQSFLSHSLFLLVWYPGRYGDPWSHLGEARYIDRVGTFYAYDWLMSQRLIADIVKYKAQYSLVVFFSRLLSFDIYWVQVFFIPLLWSLLMPVFSYKLAELLIARKSKIFPLLAAIVVGSFSPLIYWGAISVPNSLGFLFLLLTVVLILYGTKTNENRVWVLAFLTSVATFFSHPQTGIFAFVFILIAVILTSKLHSILKVILVTLTSFIYPLITYFQGATFTLEQLLSQESVLSFQVDIVTLLFLFAFLGLAFSLRGKLVKGKSALMLGVFYVVAAADYYVSMYGMQNSQVPDRVLPLMALLLVPFAAYGLFIITRFMNRSFLRAKSNSPAKWISPRSAAVFILCLILSVQVTFALFQTYPRNEITDVQPAAYEVEAVQYIDSTAEGKYVVLGDTNLATIAAGFLGIDYSYGAGARGMFGLPEWDWWSIRLYSKMGLNPSLSILEDAMYRQQVGIAYFVVSVRDPAYEDIVKRTSQVLPIDKVFGGGKLTIFKYVSTNIPINGPGPNVNVAFDGGEPQAVETSFNYFFKSAVTYTAILTGYSSYNVTSYPTYWTFFDIEVDGQSIKPDQSSDVNKFIYMTGLLPDSQVVVFWQANEHYPSVGWKDDSFKYDWYTHVLFPGSIAPNITTDGNILSLAWDFTSGLGTYQYYYYAKNVNLSTTDYPYIEVKWKSTGPVAVLTVAYTDDLSIMYPIVPYGSENSEWTTAIVKMDPGKQIAYVNVGLTNLGTSPSFDLQGIQTLFVDYILIGAPA